MQRPIHSTRIPTKTSAPKEGRYGAEIDPGFCHTIRTQKDGNEEGKATIGNGAFGEKKREK